MKKLAALLTFSMAAALSAGMLTACSSTNSGIDTSESITAETQVYNDSDDTAIDGNMSGAYYLQESLTADNDSYEVLTPSDSELADIYTFTLEDATYTLPCDASVFADAGWAPVDGDLTVEAGHYYVCMLPHGFCLNDDTSKIVGLQLVNTGDTDADWTQCTVVGITVEGDTTASFATSEGFKIGDSFDGIQEVYGATPYATDRFGTIGYHFASTDIEAGGNLWYGQQIDSLTFTASNTGFYPGWSSDNIIYNIRMEYFGDIAASE